MPVSKDKVKMAVFQLGTLKAPGPDGMSSISSISIARKDLEDAVFSFFDNGRMLKKLNHTHLVLIPKVAHPECIEQSIPIGLYNFN